MYLVFHLKVYFCYNDPFLSITQHGVLQLTLHRQGVICILIIQKTRCCKLQTLVGFDLDMDHITLKRINYYPYLSMTKIKNKSVKKSLEGIKIELLLITIILHSF